MLLATSENIVKVSGSLFEAGNKNKEDGDDCTDVTDDGDDDDDDENNANFIECHAYILGRLSEQLL